MMDQGVHAIDGDDVQVNELWDAERLGRIIGGARKREGYDRVADLSLDMFRSTGMRWHENTIYDIEGGKRLPNISLLLALMLTLNIRFEDLLPAINEGERDKARRLLS